MANITPPEAINFTALAYIDFSSLSHGETVYSLIDDGIINDYSLSKKELAALENSDSSLRDWMLINSETDTVSGFKGAAFQDGNKLVFTFRDTEIPPDQTLQDALKDAYTDLQLALPGAPAGEPNQFRDAYRFVKETVEGVAGYAMTNTQLASYVTLPIY